MEYYIIVYGLIFAVIYFVMLRPQIKKQKETQQMLDGLKAGDRVITSGGIIGNIKKIEKNDSIVIDSAGTSITIARSYIASKVSKDAKKESKK